MALEEVVTQLRKKALGQRRKPVPDAYQVWINPYVAEASPLFDEGKAGGYFLSTKQGDVYQVDDWQPGIVFVDFTYPAACAWYAGKLKALLDMGVDCFKTDFGERIPADAVYIQRCADAEQMHNLYALLYNRTVFNLLQETKGMGEAVVFARSSTAGGQQFPVHWGGDNFATYASMASTLRGGLSLGVCSFGFWSHDFSVSLFILAEQSCWSSFTSMTVG